MKAFLAIVLLVVAGHSSAQPLKSVSNSDNDYKKHQQVLASRLLSWSTGSREQINYVSVGRYANYFGFVKMRVSSAHSLKRSVVGRETIGVLTENQQNILFDLLDVQMPLITATHAARLKANDFLNEVLQGKHGGGGREQFIELARSYAVNESDLGLLLARGFAKIIATLSSEQKIELAEIRQKHTSGQADNVSHKFPALKVFSREKKQEVFNLAARFLSWTTGSMDDFAYETIGKPSQHFGFVSMRIESNHGVKRGVVADDVLALLTEEQRAELSVAATLDEKNMNAYLVAREKFLVALVKLKEEGTERNSDLRDVAFEMATREARMSWDQAMALKQILDTFAQEQTNQFIILRDKYVPQEMVKTTQLYLQCYACHGNSRLAPDLATIVNRPVAVTDYNYSPAMRKLRESGKVWNKELLNEFLANPQRTLPGTTMSYKGIDDPALRRALIDYLDESH